MPRPKLPEHLKKSKLIKIRVNKQEFHSYGSSKNRLLNYSPPLHAYDILKYCVEQIDDLALIEFLRIDKNDPLKIRLRNDYLMSRLTN